MGFGQLVVLSTDVVKLARLVVAPDRRGQGMGRVLCRLLIDRGLDRYRPRFFSLRVYRGNHAAIRVYRSLGFEPSPESSDPDGILSMRLCCESLRRHGDG